jgi:toxin FitB
VLAQRFAEPSLRLGDATRDELLERFARAGVVGGAAYEGLVALEAAAHGRTSLTLDQRAQTTYERLGVTFERIAA